MKVEVEWSSEWSVRGKGEAASVVEWVESGEWGVASLSGRRWLSVTDAGTGRLLSRVAVEGQPLALASCPSLLVAAGPTSVALLDPRDLSAGPVQRVELGRVTRTHPVASAALHPAGVLLCLGTEVEELPKAAADAEAEARLLFFDARALGGAGGEAKPLGAYSESHSGAVRCLRFGRQRGSALVSGGDDGLVNVFDVGATSEEDALLLTLNAEAAVRSVDLVGEGGVCAGTEDGRAWAWDADGVETGRLVTDKDWERSVHLVGVLGVEEEAVAVGCGGGGGRLRLGEVRGLTSSTELLGLAGAREHTDLVRAVAFRSQDSLLLTAGDDGRLIATKIRI